MTVNNYFCTTVLFLVLVGQGSPAVGQPKGEKKKGEATQQPSLSQTPIPTVETVSKQPEARDTREQAEHSRQITIVDERSRVFEWAGTIINTLLLLFVGYQAYANKQQLIYMRQALEQTKQDSAQHDRAVKAAEDDAKNAREAFYYGENPHFGVRTINLRTVQAGGIIAMDMSFMNGGRSPAWRFEAQVWVTIGDGPKSANKWPLMGSNATYADRFFAAGETRALSFYDTKRTLTNKEADAIQNEEATLFIWGTLHYWNMRGEKLWHDFTAVYHSKGNRFTDWHM